MLTIKDIFFLTLAKEVRDGRATKFREDKVVYAPSFGVIISLSLFSNSRPFAAGELTLVGQRQEH